jgi:hypothetical protein
VNNIHLLNFETVLDHRIFWRHYKKQATSVRNIFLDNTDTFHETSWIEL